MRRWRRGLAGQDVLAWDRIFNRTDKGAGFTSGVCDRQLNSEDRASRVLVLGMHATAVSFDDRSHDGETHSEPLRLRGKERLEDAQPHLGR